MKKVMSHTHAQPADSAVTKKSWQMPDTLILIFFVGIFAAILTYLIPAALLIANR
ncbi:putative S-transferase [Vibrio ponticus]|nr:putative S-transferase [Vibrio ponticus]